ncbi:transcription factor TGA2.2-like isoform X2 [Wolffia australiana]
MAYQHLGDSRISELEFIHISQDYGIHGSSHIRNLLDHEGSSYIRELEPVLMQGALGAERTSLLPGRPPHSQEMLGGWPPGFKKVNIENSQPSTESGSGQRITVEPEPSVGMKANRCWKQRKRSSSAGRTVISTVENHQPKKPRKIKPVEKDGKSSDPKTLRRLEQNREAARKSRQKKKAYLLQLESSKAKLALLEQDLQRARSQASSFGGATSNIFSSGAAIFEVEYARWLEDDERYLSELQRCIRAGLPDGDLRVVLDKSLNHQNRMFQLRDAAMKADVLHLLSGSWATPAERCFMWIGGFRPSDILKILTSKLDPLTEQQLVTIRRLRESSQQAEEGLSHGLHHLHHSLAQDFAGELPSDGLSIANQVRPKTAALGKLFELQGFLRQADDLRKELLHQMRRILTIRQGARCFLAFGEYHSRLRSFNYILDSHMQLNHEFKVLYDLRERERGNNFINAQ